VKILVHIPYSNSILWWYELRHV